MDKTRANVRLLVRGRYHLYSSNKLLCASNVLQNLISFTAHTEVSIPLPNFVTSTALVNIMKILEIDTILITDVFHPTVKYLVVLMQIIDYLAIEVLQVKIEDLIIKKINDENCFSIYKELKILQFKNSPSLTALSKCMWNINRYYENVNIEETSEDPYVQEYKMFQIFDIQQMLCNSPNISIISKILCLQNWWKRNKSSRYETEILKILKQINTDASYINKNKIKFMRGIRDRILEDILSLKTKDL